MYLLRHTWHARRGKAPEIVEDVKTVNQMFVGMGNTTGRIHVDMSGRFDTVVWQVEVESLDEFFKLERGVYVNPDPDFARLAAHLNDNTVMGSREIYEVIV